MNPKPAADSVGARRSFVVRIWLTDRPGALGAVATTLGRISADLIGIDILERGAGRAIDELIIEIGEDTPLRDVELALSAIDGVDVEEIRPRSIPVDSRLDALETAIALVEEPSIPSLLQELVSRAGGVFEAGWAVVIDHRSAVPLASVGKHPDAAWLGAFVSGSRAALLTADGGGADDVLWANLGSADLTLVMGRPGRPFRSRERRQATALVRIADARWRNLVELGSSSPSKAS